MSQKKVDRYKQEKAHRKEQLAKEKRRQKVTRIVLWAILAVFVLWIAYSVHLNVRPEPSAQETVPVETETAASETAEAEGAETQATSEAVSEESSAPEAEGTQDTAGEASETVAEPQAASSQEE